MFSKGWCDACDVHPIVSELVVACFGVAEIIAVVINSDSPEGHLPMDFFDHCLNRHVTSQMLLVSSPYSVASTNSPLKRSLNLLEPCSISYL